MTPRENGAAAGHTAEADLTPLILETSSDAFVSINDQGLVQAWNTAAVETFGWEKDEVMGRPVADLIVPERHRDAHVGAVREFIETGQSPVLGQRLEMSGMRKDGSEFPVEFTVSAIEVPGGLAFAAFIRDVSDRQRAMREQQRLATIVETSNEAIVSGTPGGRILSWNKAAERLYGYTAEESIGQPITRLLPEDSQDLVAQIRDQIMAEKPVHEVETRVRHKDGSLVEISVSVGALRDEDGKIYGLSASARDITERRLAQRALSELRGHMTGAFENAPIGMSLVGTDGTFLAVNRALCEMLGRSSDELVGDTFQSVTHADDLDADMRQLERVLEGEVDSYEMEKRYLRPDGSIVWGQLCVSLVRDQDGNPVHFISQIKDITDEMATKAELRRRAERLDDLAVQDPLTGLTNQREFNSILKREVERAQRYPSDLTLVILDVNGFRRINEEYGRARGDQILRHIASTILEVPRLPDLAARIGDDHFALLLPSTDEAGAEVVAKRVCNQLGVIDGVRTSISFGIASAEKEPGESAEHLIVRAEAALRAAKPEGEDDTPGANGLRPRARARIERILALARHQLGMDVAILTEFVDSRQLYRVVEGDARSFGMAEGSGLKIADTYCSKVLAGETEGLIADAAADPKVRDLEITRSGDIGSYAGCPVRLSSGTLFGTICGLSHRPKPSLGALDRELLEFLGEIVGAILEQDTLEVSERQAAVELSGVHALVAALEARDEYTGEHSRTVVALAVDVADRLGLSGSQVQEVEQVAILHDIGKVGIPDSVLQKRGPLTEDEWALMRQHPAIGERVIAATQSLAHLAPAIRAEHERFDGDGYPDGLRGAAIPIASRITLACDAYHAMRSDRPYRAAMSCEDSKAELLRCSGTQFDPNVIEALIEVIEDPAPADRVIAGNGSLRGVLR